MQNDELLSVKEAALFLKRSPANLYNLCWKGKLRRYRPGGRLVLFKKSELMEWVEASAIPSNDEVAAEAARR